MANLSISQIGARIFNTTKHEDSTARSSNPFAKSNMKMDVLTADVFGTKSGSISFTGNTTSSVSKMKRMASAIVGSLNDAFPTFKKGIETISAFCKRIKNNTVNFWNYLNEKEIQVPSIFDATRSIKSKWDAMNYDKAVRKLASNPVSDLETMLVNELGVKAVA